MNLTLQKLKELTELARELNSKIYVYQGILVDALENETLDNLTFNDPTNLAKMDLDLLEVSRDLYSRQITEIETTLVDLKIKFEKVCELIENFR